MDTCPTPVSDMFTALIDDGSDEAYVAFTRALLEAPTLGVLIASSSMLPGTHTIGPNDHVEMHFVRAPDGRRMVQGCEDPRAFAARFGLVNGEMPARGFLELVLQVEPAVGALICSAASEHSVPLSKDEIKRLLQPAPPPPSWAFWKR